MPPEFEQLIASNHPRIRRIAQRYAPSSGIDDLYQEILIQLWRSFKNFRGDSKVETWVYSVALNTAMTHARTFIKRKAHETEMDVIASDKEIVPADRCQADLLTHFLNSLSEIDASVLMMYLDVLSAIEIAEVLGCSVNAVNIRINRLKQKFSDAYVD
jgi:RNA polymerase sigma-70 factor, ECF subfamily